MKLIVLIGFVTIVIGQQQFENVTDFDTIDQNKDNYISFIELQKWLESSHKNVGDALQVFQNYDSNSDGKLSISEFVPLAYKFNQRQGTEDDIIFKRFDLNKDGILTKKEMETSDSTLGPEIIEGLFLVADTDANGQITLAEFRQISTAFGQQQTEKHSQNIGFVRSLLESVDANKDKKLSQLEVYTFVSQFSKVSERTVAQAFYELDTDRNQYISLSELQAQPKKITDLAGIHTLV